MSFKTISWRGNENGRLFIIDQTKLPSSQEEIELETPADIYEAIDQLKVRGAPAIGVVAAYGIVRTIQQYVNLPIEGFLENLNLMVKVLKNCRPTAVNLGWALERMRKIGETGAFYNPRKVLELLYQEALNIDNYEELTCQIMGSLGEPLIPDGGKVITHCNAGKLATTGKGTALAPIYEAWEKGKRFHVYADETRPLLQGARLTCWELKEHGIPVTIITDSMAAALMNLENISLVIVGADRIAANGDVANKIGTYGLAVQARYHQVPFYVAAPLSSFDVTLATGKEIPIEQRKSTEIQFFNQKEIVPPQGVLIWNPAFDVTPSDLITGIITERGIIHKPNTEKVLEITSRP